MNISLPDDMKAFVDEQVRVHGFATTSEYMRALIRERKEGIERLRALVIEGMESGDAGPAEDVSARLRAKIEAARMGMKAAE
ncbi:type II toxin-antitoxin system ParD family antitoxin [Cypionkella sp.]|uniref:ribbon-helix-helix domain-containing protein n=1 Tax=Cypionkella sp. TaxID=2811411 RepID=UPI002639D386|nr:type II toxin-antitoxin system ParD family antitoxin [Cypionkella sp.]MDB5665668.1 addiction module antitoxin [Cypionkella sp.]